MEQDKLFEVYEKINNFYVDR